MRSIYAILSEDNTYGLDRKEGRDYATDSKMDIKMYLGFDLAFTSSYFIKGRMVHKRCAFHVDG